MADLHHAEKLREKAIEFIRINSTDPVIVQGMFELPHNLISELIANGRVASKKKKMTKNETAPRRSIRKRKCRAE
jgi:hypothetical protein